MPTFILLTKLSPESLGRLKDRKQVGSQWLEAVKAETWGAIPYKRFLEIAKKI